MSVVIDGTTGITTPGIVNTGSETVVNLTTSGNTILGDATTDTLNVGNGGLVKDASGNVGIGTASPSFISGYGGLQINGGGNGSVVHLTNSTTGTTSTDGFDLILSQGSSDAYVWQRENAPLIFGTNATERMRISSGGQVTLANQPRFFAYGASGASGTSANYWIFPTTTVNTGSHYDTSTGIFTAPIAGVYKFTWSNIGSNVVDVYRYYIRINNVDVSSFQLRLDVAVAGKYADSASVTYMTTLSQGQTVRIYFVSDGGNASYNSGSYPWFTGELIG